MVEICNSGGRTYHVPNHDGTVYEHHIPLCGARATHRYRSKSHPEMSWLFRCELHAQHLDRNYVDVETLFQ